MQQPILCWIVPFALTTTACNIFVKVPQESSGDMQMTLRNRLDHDLCEFAMTPEGATHASGNWLRTANVGAGSGRTFGIKPGNYHVEAGCGTTFHGVADLNLAQSSAIYVGIAADARQYQRTYPFVPVVGQVSRYVEPVSAPSGGEGGGGEGAASKSGGSEECLRSGEKPKRESDCCSRHVHWPDDQMSYAMAQYKGLFVCD
jgi:hypothetical protein